MSLQKIKIISITFLAAATMSGCATVDLNQMASPTPDNVSESEINVVQRAALRLKNVFTNKGFVAKTSRKRMRSAARVLLNGLEEKQVTQSDGQAGYLATSKSVSIIVADIKFAQQHVLQVTKAAEVYLEIAPANRNLRKELISLETALVASREATQIFTVSLNGVEPPELATFKADVDHLREITDEFGVRVRSQAIEQLEGAS